MIKKLNKLDIRIMVPLAVVLIALLLCTGLKFSAVVCATAERAAANQELVVGLRDMAENGGVVKEKMQMASFRAAEIERALPHNLSQEVILLDVYRAKHAVPEFDHGSVQVRFIEDREVKPVREGELLRETIRIDFNATYANAKAFIMELEMAARTYMLRSLSLEGDGNSVAASMVVTAYGMTPLEGEREVFEEYGHRWFSPFQHGKVNLFQWQPQLSYVDLNQRLFNRLAPASNVRDFAIHINSRRADRPEVVFQKHQELTSALGGAVSNVGLYLTQVNGRYFYSFTVGTDRFPPTQVAELRVSGDRGIIIEVFDDSDWDELVDIGQVTLAIDNQTGREVVLVGDTNRRLRVIGN